MRPKVRLAGALRGRPGKNVRRLSFCGVLLRDEGGECRRVNVEYCRSGDTAGRSENGSRSSGISDLRRERTEAKKHRTKPVGTLSGSLGSETFYKSSPSGRLGVSSVDTGKRPDRKCARPEREFLSLSNKVSGPSNNVCLPSVFSGVSGGRCPVSGIFAS